MIRPAEPRDAEAIAAIHNEGIAERVATFETEPRTAGDVRPWIGAALPLLVAEEDGRVLGWAKLGEYSDRCAYAGVAEVSVYVGRQGRGRGTGGALVDAICAAAEERGIWKLVALVFPENEPSLRLFARCGFREVGTFRRHGRLDGAWRDVVILERSLGEASEPRSGGGAPAGSRPSPHPPPTPRA
ncbi:MAG TPA: arsinothricin resistance N-acetyltransferase ArsN1 family A [Thermoleophilaceae bacterium]